MYCRRCRARRLVVGSNVRTNCSTRASAGLRLTALRQQALETRRTGSTGDDKAAPDYANASSAACLCSVNEEDISSLMSQ